MSTTTEQALNKIKSALEHIDAVESDLGWTEHSEAAKAALNEAIAALAQLAQEPVMWLETEESMRGKSLAELLTPPVAMMYSSRWHYGPKRPATNNPVWPVFAGPQPSAPVAQDVQAVMFEVYEYARISDGIDAATFEQRDNQKRKMMAQANKIRALLSTAPQVEQVEAKEGWKQALHAAVRAIYFDDSSDYGTALWEVIQNLAPELVGQLERNPAAVYIKTKKDAAAPSSQKEGEQPK